MNRLTRTAGALLGVVVPYGYRRSLRWLSLVQSMPAKAGARSVTLLTTRDGRWQPTGQLSVPVSVIAFL